MCLPVYLFLSYPTLPLTRFLLSLENSVNGHGLRLKVTLSFRRLNFLSHLKPELVKNERESSVPGLLSKKKLLRKNWLWCDLRGGGEACNNVRFSQKECSVVVKWTHVATQEIRVQVPLLLLTSLSLRRLSVKWRWKMELSSWDHCQFKCYNAWKARTVTGKVGASVNAQPAIATQLLLLPWLLFQDTSAPAHRDSVPLSPREKRSDPRRTAQIIVRATSISQALPRVPCQCKAFMKETQWGDKRFVPLGGKKKIQPQHLDKK